MTNYAAENNPYIGMDVAELVLLKEVKAAEKEALSDSVWDLLRTDRAKLNEVVNEISQLGRDIKKINYAIANPPEPVPEPEPEPDKPGIGYPDLWAIYEERTKDEFGKVMPPKLDIDGVEFGEDGWSTMPDENGGFIYKPMIDQFERTVNGDDRVQRYAAHIWPEYHYTYITLPEAFEDDPDLGQFVAENYSEAQENRPFLFNHKAGWMPVKAWREWDAHEPLFGSWLKGYALIWSGNAPKDAEGDWGARLQAAIVKSRKRFEDYVNDNRVNQAAYVRAKYMLRNLDRWYSWLDSDEEREQFVAEHPFYEPPEA